MNILHAVHLNQKFQGTWLAQLVEQVTLILDPGVVSLSPTLGVQVT